MCYSLFELSKDAYMAYDVKRGAQSSHCRNTEKKTNYILILNMSKFQYFLSNVLVISFVNIIILNKYVC